MMIMMNVRSRGRYKTPRERDLVEFVHWYLNANDLSGQQ